MTGDALLIAPTRGAADELIWSRRISALGLHRFTLAQLASQIAATSRTPVTPLAQEALVARAVDELRRKKQLGYFAPVAGTPGFVRAAAATINELRLNHAPPPGDLAPLAKLYDELMQEAGLADLAEGFRLASEVEESRYFGLALFLLDIPLRTRRERDFLQYLIKRSRSVTAVILSGDEESLLSKEAAEIDEPLTNAVERVRHYVFSPEVPPDAAIDETFDYFSAPGENFECVEIARRIQRSGIPFDRIAILLRHPDRYQPLVEDALRRAGIPGWFSHGTVRPDPAGRAFLSLLHCALDHYSASRFAEYISLGQMPREEDEQIAPYAWEQLIVDAAVVGGADRWDRRLAGLANELRANEASEFRIQQLEKLRAFAVPMIERLATLPHGRTWGDWLSALHDLAQASLRSSDGVLEILNELEPMSEIGPVSLEEVYSVFSERLGTLRREPSPRRFGQVFTGTIEEARGRHFELVFLPGLAEGLFPRRAQEDPLLLDEARVPLGLPTQDTRFNRERLLLRIAAAAGDRLVVSYPRMDTAQSRPRVPSFYAFEVMRAAVGSLPDLREFEESARSGASVRLGWPAPSDPSLAIDDAEYDLAVLAGPVGKGTGRYMLETSSTLGRAMRSRGRRWRQKWYDEDGIVAPLDVLKAHRLSARAYSATSLQRFATCPYQFFLHSIYRLEPREESVAIEQLDPLTRGTLFHEVQRRFFEKLSPWTQRPIAELLDTLDRTLDEIAAQYKENLAPAIDRVWESEIEEMRTDLRGWLRETSRSPEWVPLLFEHEFEQEIFGAKLRGKIDLAEEHAARGVLRVTDHKTGKPPKERAAFVGGGRVLQPLIYAAALAAETGKTVEKGRLFYATQRGGYFETEIPVTEIAKNRATEALKIIDDSIERGFLAAAPIKDACKICDYRAVCGPYEEIRIAKKSAEPLESLFVLREIP